MTRGDVYRVRFGRGRGHAQHGPRYGVIVQSTALLALSTCLVAPPACTWVVIEVSRLRDQKLGAWVAQVVDPEAQLRSIGVSGEAARMIWTIRLRSTVPRPQGAHCTNAPSGASHTFVSRRWVETMYGARSSAAYTGSSPA